MTSDPFSKNRFDKFLEHFFCDVQRLKNQNFNIYPNHEQDWIHRSYPHFIRFFHEKKTLNEQDVMIGRFLTYGWMPTILKELGDVSKENDLVECLNRAKYHKEERLGAQEIKYIASCINNSVVGASKLLHFINPDVYAIWDSRVCRYLHKYDLGFPEKIPQYNTKSKPHYRYQVYIKYLDLIKKLSLKPEFNEAKDCFQEKINYHITDTRFAEYVMYFWGEDKK